MMREVGGVSDPNLHLMHNILSTPRVVWHPLRFGGTSIQCTT